MAVLSTEHAKILEMMDKAETTKDEVQELYSKWCQTYDKVRCKTF